MSLRQTINNNPVAVTGVAVALLFVALGVMVLTTTASNSRGGDRVYYYDLRTDELFVDRADQFPPIQGPSGHRAGVQAYVFACGECPSRQELVGLSQQRIAENTNAFVGYFRRYSDRAQEILASQKPFDERDSDDQAYMARMRGGELVRASTDDQWIPAESDRGRSLRGEVMTCDGDAIPRECRP